MKLIRANPWMNQIRVHQAAFVGNRWRSESRNRGEVSGVRRRYVEIDGLGITGAVRACGEQMQECSGTDITGTLWPEWRQRWLWKNRWADKIAQDRRININILTSSVSRALTASTTTIYKPWHRTQRLCLELGLEEASLIVYSQSATYLGWRCITTKETDLQELGEVKGGKRHRSMEPRAIQFVHDKVVQSGLR